MRQGVEDLRCPYWIETECGRMALCSASFFPTRLLMLRPRFFRTSAFVCLHFSGNWRFILVFSTNCLCSGRFAASFDYLSDNASSIFCSLGFAWRNRFWRRSSSGVDDDWPFVFFARWYFSFGTFFVNTCTHDLHALFLLRSQLRSRASPSAHEWACSPPSPNLNRRI